MCPPGRDNRISRRNWLLAGLALPLSRSFGANTITVAYDGDNVWPVAPNLHFLTGKLLERLKNADIVVFLAKLSLITTDRAYPFRETPGTFLVSYDIWEESFKVTISGPGRRSRSDMTASQAEAWCLESLVINTSGLAPDRPFFLKLEMSAPNPKEFSSVMANSGISLRAFMELLSRKAGPDEPHWTYESDRRRLSDLVRAQGRGARSG